MWSQVISPFIRILEPLRVLHTVHMASISYWSSVSRVWWRPDFRENFGFFERRKFPWSPSKVGTFYRFTLKVGSKYTYTILEALVWSQQIKRLTKNAKHVCNTAAKRVDPCDAVCFTTDVRIRLQGFFVVGGKTRDIVIELVLQQYRFL